MPRIPSATSSGITCARPASWCSTATTAAALNNTIIVNGKKISSPIRQETVSIRGIVAGEYTVNVNHYLATTGAPVPVAVKVEKVNPAVEVVHYDTITLDHTGQERTAVRFRLADNGNVVDVNHREKSLIQLTRSVRRTAK